MSIFFYTGQATTVGGWSYKILFGTAMWIIFLALVFLGSRARPTTKKIRNGNNRLLIFTIIAAVGVGLVTYGITFAAAHARPVITSEAIYVGGVLAVLGLSGFYEQLKKF